MPSWPTWAAMAGGHNRRGPIWGVGHARRSWNAVRDDYPRPSLMGNAARALPFPKSKRPTCPFSFAPGGTPPARPYAAPTPARCEPFLAFPLLPRPSTCLAWPSATSGAARCEPVPAFRLLPGPSTCPAWLSATSVASRCEPVPAFPLLLGRPHALQSLLRLPSLPGVSRFRRSAHTCVACRLLARHYGSGRLGTGSLLRCFCVEQEAACSRCAAQQDISAVPYR